MKRLLGKALDNAISLGVVIIVLFLIIPIRTELLDFLLIINIGLSIMILMITMNISETLEFSIFPSLLLVTTLFRLGLNVSSTRAILSKGYAGEVIQNFGNLITGGNIVVGKQRDRRRGRKCYLSAVPCHCSDTGSKAVYARRGRKGYERYLSVVCGVARDVVH